MKKLMQWLLASITLGTITGILISMGSHMLLAVALMCAFWAGMLAPVLIRES